MLCFPHNSDISYISYILIGCQYLETCEIIYANIRYLLKSGAVDRALLPDRGVSTGALPLHICTNDLDALYQYLMF
jgi:hypothetical protein